MSSPKLLPSPVIGGIYAFVAYICWGLSPLFWKQLLRFPPTAMLGYRILWSCLILLMLGLIYRQHAKRDLALLRSRREILLLLGATLLIAINWYMYISAVTSGHIVEASLGYFLNPLGNVLLGIAFFKERLSRAGWFAFGLAAVAVSNLVIQQGEVPWISLGLAGSFALYGICKKLLALSPAVSLALETALMAPIAVLLIQAYFPGSAMIAGLSPTDHLMFFLSGIITLVPLFAFGKAAKLLPYSILGFYQYLAPIMQLFCGVVIYKEAFPLARKLSFALIGLSLLTLSTEQILLYRKRRAAH